VLLALPAAVTLQYSLAQLAWQGVVLSSVLSWLWLAMPGVMLACHAGNMLHCRRADVMLQASASAFALVNTMHASMLRVRSYQKHAWCGCLLQAARLVCCTMYELHCVAMAAAQELAYSACKGPCCPLWTT
jgi:hypothetical protein